MAGTDYENAISELKSTASSAPGLDDLRAARVLLAGSGFKSELADLLDRTHNQPRERAAIADALSELRYAFGDLLANRVEEHSATSLISIGGGVALSVSTLMALATQAFTYPFLAVLPLVIGLHFGWRGLMTNKRLALEIAALRDIVDALDGHTGAVMRSE